MKISVWNVILLILISNSNSKILLLELLLLLLLLLLLCIDWCHKYHAVIKQGHQWSSGLLPLRGELHYLDRWRRETVQSGGGSWCRWRHGAGDRMSEWGGSALHVNKSENTVRREQRAERGRRRMIMMRMRMVMMTKVVMMMMMLENIQQYSLFLTAL